MSPGRETGRRFTDNCPECGAALREGAERCPFCGKRFNHAAGATPVARRPPRVTGAALGAIVAVGLILAAAGYLARRPGAIAPPVPPAAADPLEAKRRAGAACEERIRREVRNPFRVIRFPTSLVAEEREGYVVTGSVDLQSLSGDLARRRYRCRVRPGPDGPVVEEGRLE